MAGGDRGPACALDEAVAETRAALARQGAPDPRALFLLGTGAGLLPLRLRGARRSSWSSVPGVPENWRGATFHAGELGGGPVWILEDSPGPPEHAGLPDPGDPPWTRGFPCWLAAAAGAAVLVHSSAGSALVPELEPGTLALVADHLNLSGRTPLLGLARSKLGPLFPDLSGLHDAGLRSKALEISRSLGLKYAEVVAACTMSPALETPAERRCFACAGAQVSVQGLEGPLLAAAHAGLALLAVVCVTDAGEGPTDLGRIVRTAQAMAPGLEDLLLRLAPAITAETGGLEVEA